MDQSGLLCGSEWPLREQEWLSTWFNASNDWNKKRLPSGCDHGEKVHGGLLCLHEAGAVELLLLLQLGLLLLLLLQLVLLLLLLLQLGLLLLLLLQLVLLLLLLLQLV